MHAAFATPQFIALAYCAYAAKRIELSCASFLRKWWGIPGVDYDPGRMDLDKASWLDSTHRICVSTAQSASAILCHTWYCLICSPHESLSNHLGYKL